MPKYKKSKLHLEEFVKINGIEQYLFHAGTKAENPVLLFLHGGPGESFSLFSHLFQQSLEEIYTIVHWDQRGAGKTLIRNPQEEYFPTIDSLIKDLYEIIEYLKNKYNKEKIVLLGHSWGSALGTLFIKKYPKNIEYYIGVGQLISMMEGETVGFNKLQETLIKNKDTKSLDILNTIGKYPNDDITINKKNIATVRKLQAKYKLAAGPTPSLVLGVMKSPLLKLSDFKTLLVSNSKPNNSLYQSLWDFNLYKYNHIYKVPIYYVLGENDWQVPTTIASKYFQKVEAPHKKIIIIPNSGHAPMLDQPELFFEALKEIQIFKHL